MMKHFVCFIVLSLILLQHNVLLRCEEGNKMKLVMFVYAAQTSPPVFQQQQCTVDQMCKRTCHQKRAGVLLFIVLI